MKRSDIVKLMISTYMDNNLYCLRTRFEMVMDAILEAGMLPPNDGKTRAIKKSSVPCVINVLNCHSWEPETESNDDE